MNSWTRYGPKTRVSKVELATKVTGPTARCPSLLRAAPRRSLGDRHGGLSCRPPHLIRTLPPRQSPPRHHLITSLDLTPSPHLTPPHPTLTSSPRLTPPGDRRPGEAAEHPRPRALPRRHLGARPPPWPPHPHPRRLRRLRRTRAAAPEPSPHLIAAPDRRAAAPKRRWRRRQVISRSSEGHGKVWGGWMQKVHAVYPGFDLSTRHGYAIHKVRPSQRRRVRDLQS